ncbi:MAG TPA: META domain-containing protein [Acidimicrobiales bacterium]|jgi:heat shock protein HslJ
MTSTRGHRRRWGGAIVVLAATRALLTSACARNKEVDTLSATYGLPSQVDLEAEQWLLAPAQSTIAIGTGHPVTLVVNDDTVRGSGPCNSYRGTIDVGLDCVTITDLNTTLASCVPPSVMAAEARYLAALKAVDTVDFSDDHHHTTLSNDKGVKLSYDAFHLEDHLVGTWNIVNINTGDALASVVAGTNPSITFGGDGTLQVDTGCSSANSSWELEGDKLTINPVRQTQKACPDPGGVMQQEAALVQGLERVDRGDHPDDAHHPGFRRHHRPRGRARLTRSC